ncbi:ABC transporter ATP-binding protein [Mahella sp.]|uniref:ABC transporter ATP-binding protein n=1 Tax=Mahella sp. TaxID=2798721 RepID=UPI0025C434E5|nr:ABC transporter ATP-binding protein [Mahella sp.]MBZ4666271.1 hypothetical protein [Mahella sp.]
MENNNIVLEIKKICKTYDDFKLNNISFDLRSGEIIGLIGPNGAGKSTIIKIILKIIESDSGKITFLGDEILNNNQVLYKEHIGYVGENIDFFLNQRLKNIKNFYRVHYSNWDEEHYQYLLKTVFELNDESRPKELSKGMKVKFSLALALSHNPKLLILDEPTSGLDPIVRGKILKILKEYADKKSVAIIFSSHITEDMNKIANKLVFLNKGQILESCTVKDVLDKKYSIDEYLEMLINDKE